MNRYLENQIYNLKKNNIDDFFLNVSEDPIELKNKDFRFSLSNIYQIIEDEFADTFLKSNIPLRNTNFYFLKENDKISVFITPVNSFEFYIKQKGSLYRFNSEYREIEGKLKEGFLVDINVVFEYFCNFNEILEYEYLTSSFMYLNLLVFVINKLVEKLYIIPKIKSNENFFSTEYDFFMVNEQISKILDILKNEFSSEFILNNSQNLAQEIMSRYLNYIIFKFFQIKITKFKDYKAAAYFVRSFQHKKVLRSVDYAYSIENWLDEIYLGKYSILPQLYIKKISDNRFDLTLNILNMRDKSVLSLQDLLKEENPFGLDKNYVHKIIENQVLYIKKYFDKIDDCLDEKKNYILSIDLNEVYMIISQTSYYLNKAKIEVILPEELGKIYTPRPSINATVKHEREKNLYEFMNDTSSTTINLEDIMDFKYQIVIGEERLSIEEFEKLNQNNEGLVEYKNMYVLLDKSKEAIFKKPLNIVNMTKMELIHSFFSGQIKEYDFDYDSAFANILKDLDKKVEVEISQNLTGTLRPYQVTGFKWLYTNTLKGFGSCIADDMGLGKTIQVISLILKLKDEKKLKKPVIVVCPTTLLGNWYKELKTFAPTLKASIYHGAERVLEMNSDIILTTFAILRLDFEILLKTKWSMIVVDEAQNIKNPDTSQTQAIKGLKSDIKIAMTGTPVENRLTEMWSIFDFINKGYLGSLREFQKSYAIPIEKFKEVKRADRLKLSVSPFVLRRLKTDKNVIDDLPEKVVVNDYCYLTKYQTALYQKVLDSLMGEITQLKGINRRGVVFKLITFLKQICNHPYQYLKNGDMSKELSGKMEKTMSLLETILENNEKALIFSQYKEMGSILEQLIKKEFNIEPLFFHGSLNRKQREDYITQFQENPNKKIMILSLKAGGTGLNLTSATNVIHYDLWWNPAVEDQATDRTYRIGQNKNVMVHRLITLGTFEEKIDEMLKAKKELVDMAVYEGEKIISDLTDEQIYEIFSLL